MGPELKTERLLLRDWRDEDAAAAFEMYSDPEVRRFLGDGRFAQSIEEMKIQLRSWHAKYAQPEFAGMHFWAVEVHEKGTDAGEVVGTALVKPIPGGDGEIEIGWHLMRRHWGKGYATEFARALVAYAFDVLLLDFVLALVAPENTKSAAVTERLGMERGERTTRFYGMEADVYRLDAATWRARGSAAR